MHNYLTHLMKNQDVRVVGYAIIQDNYIVQAETISIDPTIHSTIDSMFQAASISKALTAFAASELITQNKIQLNTPINQQLLTWKIPDDNAGYNNIITPRECLSMTSGLSYGKPGSKFDGYPQAHPIPTLDELLNGEKPATNPAINAYNFPGEYYAYTGAGYMVMQKLIEDITKKSFDLWMQETVFSRIGMPHSTYECPFHPSNNQQAIPGFDVNHHLLKGGWDNIPAPASGGLWSTPSDIARFMISLSQSYLNQNTWLSPEIATIMFTQQKNSLLGLGLVPEGKDKSFNFRKIGNNTGYYNLLMMFPNSGQGVIIMTDSANGVDLIKPFVAYIAKQQNWPMYSDNFDETTLNRYTTANHSKP